MSQPDTETALVYVHSRNKIQPLKNLTTCDCNSITKNAASKLVAHYSCMNLMMAIKQWQSVDAEAVSCRCNQHLWLSEQTDHANALALCRSVGLLRIVWTLKLKLQWSGFWINKYKNVRNHWITLFGFNSQFWMDTKRARLVTRDAWSLRAKCHGRDTLDVAAVEAGGPEASAATTRQTRSHTSEDVNALRHNLIKKN